MKTKKNIKKVVKKIDKSKASSLRKPKNNDEVDLWKEIRTNFKPLVKTYKKFQKKRKIAKEKEERIRFREQEEQRLREEEVLRMQEQEEKRLKREKNLKEEKEKRIKAQEDLRLEEKKIRDDRNEKKRQEQIYRAKLIKAEEARIEQLKKAHESRNEERKLRNERNLDKKSSLVDKNNLEDKEFKSRQEAQRLKDKVQRLNEKEHSLKEKEEEQKLKERKKIDSDDVQKEKRLNGTVLWFNEAKGYGFIKRKDNEKNIFVHFSAIHNSGLNNLKTDDLITFEVEHSEKGLSAVNLQKPVNELFRAQLKVIK